MKPTAILTADMHCQDRKPACRLDDDYINATQVFKWSWLAALQQTLACPILHAGDLLGGDTTQDWKASPYLLGLMLQYLPDHMITIPGNHDLPAHKMDRLKESGLYVMAQSKKVTLLGEEETSLDHFCRQTEMGIEHDKIQLCTFPWGSPLKQPSDQNNWLRRVAMLHAEVYEGRAPYPGADPNGNALRVLKKFPEYDLILSGHVHDSFCVSYQGRLLVNPGSLLRIDADQMDHKPRVFLWYAENNTVESVYCPIEPGMVSRDHIDVKAERGQRLEAFVERLKDVKRPTLHFETNLERFFGANRVRRQTEQLAWEFTQGEK